MLFGWKFREFSLLLRSSKATSTCFYLHDQIFISSSWVGSETCKTRCSTAWFSLRERQNKNAGNVKLVIESTALDKFCSLLIEALLGETKFLLLCWDPLWSLTSSLAYGCAKNSLSACQSTFPSYLQLDNGRWGIINLIIKIFSQEIEGIESHDVRTLRLAEPCLASLLTGTALSRKKSTLQVSFARTAALLRDA